jgi:O-antigen/teichoic acid export membrane protein
LIGETVVARELQPELYGDIALAYTMVATVGNVLLLGIHEGVTRIGSAEENEGARVEVIVAGTLTAAVSGTVGMLLLILFSETLANLFSEPVLRRYLVLVAPFLVLYPLSRIVIAALRVQERSGAMVLTRAFISRAVSLCVLGVAVLLGLDVWIGVSYWLSVPLTIVVVGGLFVFKRLEVSSSERPNRGRFTELWSFSWPLALSSIVFLFLSQLDILMIGAFLDSSDVGYYRAISPLRQSATLFIGAFSFLFLPLATQYFERNKVEEFDEVFSSVTKWGVLLTLPIILSFVFIPEIVVTTVFGSSYVAASLPLAILTGGLFFRAVAGPNGDVVKAINMPKVELYAGSVGVSVNVFLNVILIPRLGISGAALATVSGYFVYNAVELVFIYREIRVTPFSSDIFKPVVATTLVVWIFRHYVPLDAGFVPLIGFGLFAVMCTVTCFILTNSVGETDLMLVDEIESRSGKDLSVLYAFLRLGYR